VRKPSFTTIVIWVLGLLSVAGAIGLWFALQFGQIAAGYTARQLCACLYVQGRQEDECRAEIGPMIQQSQVVYFDERVVVNFLGLDRAQARLTPGYGCAVTRFEGSMPAGMDLQLDPS
jgi:hypothetical protein